LDYGNPLNDYNPAMLRKPLTIGFWRGRLPHWEVEDGRYFVTIHLAGAIPSSGAEKIRLLSEELCSKSSVNAAESGLLLSRTIFREMEKWLDTSEENLLLGNPAIAQMILEAIEHRVKTGKWIVYRFIIMPNHIHLFMSVLKSTLKESLEDFKRWTGHQAAKLVELPNDRFWQDEWFDHWSRSDEQDDQIEAYIFDNPRKAGLVKRSEDWKYGGTYQ
jgi:putative transposase